MQYKIEQPRKGGELDTVRMETGTAGSGRSTGVGFAADLACAVLGDASLLFQA